MADTLPDRQSIRKRGWDYAAKGWYFVTINTLKGKPLFGVVVNGRMVLNEAGRVAEEEWRKSATLRKGLVLDEFVVMPNHVHGLVRLDGRGFDASNPSASNPSASSPSASRPHPPAQFGKPVAGSLGVFVGAYKAAVSRNLGRRGLMHQAPAVWHRNYWDVIVQDEKALANIRNYIRFNPQNYAAVMQCGEPRFIGNQALLMQPKVGFLASRGAPSLHGTLPLCKDEAILSGFLSPLERQVFWAGLKNKRPLIWVKPWSLDEGLNVPAIQTALAEGRLLVLSPFEKSAAPSVRRALWCNEYVIAQCQRLVVGHLNPEGMLSCILSEADPDKQLVYL
jgi:REP element-mobilizing transposase RayT